MDLELAVCTDDLNILRNMSVLRRFEGESRHKFGVGVKAFEMANKSYVKMSTFL